MRDNRKYTRSDKNYTDETQQCYLTPGGGDIPAFTPAKLVLDLANPAELT